MTLVPISLHSWLFRIGEALHALAVKLDGPGLFLVAIADSSFLSIPEGNDLLIVILSTGKGWDRMAYYVGMTILGSVTGCLLLYSVGRKGGNPLLKRKFSEENLRRAERLYQRYGVLTVVVPSILPPPTPFKIFVLTAGAFRLSLPAFVCAVAVGRTIRYLMWGILAVLYGNDVKIYMQQNLPRLGIYLFILLALVLGSMATIYYFRRRRASARERIDKNLDQCL